MSNATIPSRDHDAVTIARLERLAARRPPSGPGTLGPDGSPTIKAASRRRPHPSKKSRVAALGLSLATTGGLTYTFAASAATAGAANAVPAGVVATSATAAASSAAPTTATTTATAVNAPTTTASSTSTAAAAPTTAASTMTGGTTTVNGAVYTNKFGAVQVQAVFAANGSLASVNVIQLPTDRKSVTINNSAVPVLNSEALAAQSATVHTVSGATYTSNDYVKSLQSAIDIARANGITKLT